MTDWSRRAVLRSAPGLLGVAGCPQGASVSPTLAFVGPDPARGHVVRDAAARVVVPTQREKVGVVIVGAGVAGLAAAWRLQRAGFTDLRVIELEDEPFGTARGGALPRSPYPMGAHYLPVPHRDFTALHTLLDDIGLVVGREADGTPELDPRLVVRDPVERHRHRGLWADGLYPMSGADKGALDQLARLRERLATLDRRGSDGRRLFDLPLRRSSADLRELDALSMAQWLDREGLDDWRVRWLCDYGCRDDYGCTIAQTSAFAGLHHFVARGLEDDHDRMLLSWPQGNAGLCERMATRIDLGDRLRTGAAVLRIDPDAGTVVAWDAATDETFGYDADVVLWAAPRFVLRHVVARDPLPKDALTYTPWLVANVEVARRPRGTGAPLAWDNVEIGADHLGYVVANHLEDLDERREGAVLTYYEPRPADDAAGLAARRGELLAASLGELADHVTRQLAGMHGEIARDIRAIHLCRWGHAMVRPVPGSLFSPTAELARAPIGRVIPCAADASGLPLFEQAFASAVDAAELALARLGHATVPMVPA
jgi:glycine/D-amino acid oxidase-like deaminating enzyme